MTRLAVESLAENNLTSGELVMNAWTMTYPYLTFFLMLSSILLLNNLVLALSKSHNNNSTKTHDVDVAKTSEKLSDTEENN